MGLSRGKINHLSQLIVDGLENVPGVMFYEDDNDIRLEVVKALNEALKVEDEIDAFVRQKLNSYSKPLPEGSREWDVLYDKFYDEEVDKRLV
ncbi:MAG: hypothetical protein ETSY1_14230 [Candidatus Entotheonella factor]|uniref:DUF507 domain-containing protein n=1 Tax=Entotheonella factor TaxID=1429438 RepID=W4LNH6_ENTF1|nr:MAG: hypothetical protein ETSY1_14230 [Candidatus Entotheonella factor]